MQASDLAGRVVVTGLGAVSPYGRGLQALWNGVLSGESAIGDIDVFDAREHRTHLAGQVRGDYGDVGEHLPEREALRLTRSERFALAAAREAVAHAGAGAGLTHGGVFLGCSSGGMFEGERFYLSERHGTFVKMFTGHQSNAPANAVARALGMTGPIEVSSAACSASAMALEGALQALRDGEIDVAVAGGADGLCELTFAGFNALRAVDEGPCLPFRAQRQGMSIGEGAGIVILETLARALERGATPLAEFVGAGSACDAYHMTAPDPDGKGAALAMRAAMDDAGIQPGDVDFLNLHATGTPHNDAAEWKAIERVFGERAGHLPATSTKACVGHLLGACGGLEAVVTVMSLSTGQLHPTPGAGPVDPESPVDLVLGQARDLGHPTYAMSTNLAFGGANGSLLFRRWDGLDQ